jgi:glycosyltransferase involved in cell wall biosynthesis
LSEPLVSVLLPAFDADATLASCLRSLQRQSESRWECVLVDDGSRDGTQRVAASFADRDPRIRLLACEHRGLVESLCRGLEACRAPLVARMDADDCMHRDRLAWQLRALAEQPALSAVGSQVRIFPRHSLTPGRRRYESWLNQVETPLQVRSEAFVECPIAHPTLCARRDVLDRFAWRDRGWPEDYDLILRMLEAGLDLAVVPRRLLAWRDAPQRLSRNADAYRLERFTACKAAFLAGGLLANSSEYVLWGYGDTGRQLRRALLAHGRQPSHIVELHPGRLGQRIHGSPVVSPTALRTLPRRPIVASVAGAGPREQIRATLTEMSFRETIDFVCAA